MSQSYLEWEPLMQASASSHVSEYSSNKHIGLTRDLGEMDSLFTLDSKTSETRYPY